MARPKKEEFPPTTGYINYAQIEALLKALPMLKTLLGSLQIELNKLHRQGKARPDNPITEDEILEALTVGNRTLSDMPRSYSTFDDKVNKVIAQKDKIMEEITGSRDDLAYLKRDLIKDIHAIAEVVEKVDTAISNLTPNQQYILEWVYKEGTSRKTWKDIAQDLNTYKLIVQKDRRAAIEKMEKVLRITVESYTYVMGKIDR